MLLSTEALLAPNNLFNIKKYVLLLKNLIFKNDRGTIRNHTNFLFLIPFFTVEIKVLLICILIDYTGALLPKCLFKYYNESVSELVSY